jgi:hypothetical protein
LTTALFESTWLQSSAPSGVLGDYYMLDRSDNETLQVDWAVGACLLVRREVIDQVGKLDEGFFMYSEELDWCRRIKGAGWKIVYLPKAQVIHHMGKSSDQVVAQRHIYFQTSKVRYFRKHHGQWAAVGCGSALAMYVGSDAGSSKGADRSQARGAPCERVRAYRWRRFGLGMKIGLVTGEYAPMQGVGDFTGEVARRCGPGARGHRHHWATSHGAGRYLMHVAYRSSA